MRLEERSSDRRKRYVFICLCYFVKSLPNNVTTNYNLTSMPVTNAQKAAVEQVIQAIKSVTSPRKKRVLAELFLELIDKETWANYYQVTLPIVVLLSVILSPRRSFPDPVL